MLKYIDATYSTNRRQSNDARLAARRCHGTRAASGLPIQSHDCVAKIDLSANTAQ
jgi:hypothetical protein